MELCRLRFDNSRSGDISVSKDGGQSWEKIGAVLKPSEKVEPKGFTASKWMAPVHVTATAVNAIHITTDYDPNTDKGGVFSIIPKSVETGGISFLSPSASIYTDFPAGTGIFGGGLAPFVGNALLVERAGKTFEPEKGYVPAKGDLITIIVTRFAEQPTQIVFENHVGGLIYFQFPDGSRRAIGYVVRPVHGVGRFVGGRYAALGRIRANHPGVVDVSCSPMGEIGGFQIIPLHHAHSPEMGKALTMTQWMVVAPLPPRDHWEGMPPLFYQYIRPDYRPDDIYAADWQEKLLSRFLVEVRKNDGPWGPCPALSLNPNLDLPLPEGANRALEDVSGVRILFPIWEKQGKQ
jgi:hypothetical protein